jgi:hypothetical protein
MASPGSEKTVGPKVSGSSFNELIANSFDFGSIEPSFHGKVTLASGYQDISWKNIPFEGLSDLTWEIVNLDSVTFKKIKWDADEVSKELLWNSFDGLETSNLSRLARVVRDWSSFAAEEPIVTGETCEIVDGADLSEDVLLDSNLFTLMHESSHELLERKAGKELWNWFTDWRDWFLSLAERFKTLGEEEIFNLLKLAVAARRSAPRPRAPRQRQAPAERLLRLAKSIVPNAPPFPLRSEVLLTGVG